MEPLCHINDMARRLAAAFWPGPLTMILPKKDIVPAVVTAGLDSVAIRMPSHPVARALIEACGLPIAAPSGNRSGRPSPTLAAHMLEDMDGRIPLILDGGACDVGVESTVVALTGDIATVLRPGGITPDMLAGVLGQVQVADSVMRPLEDDVDRALLLRALSRLPPRERQIISMRFGIDLPEAMTQKEVADRLGISQSYISRLEKRIIAKMRRDIVSQI